MVEGKKNLPGEAESTKYPIDVEARLTSLGLYEKLEKTKNCIKIMRCVYEALNTAYSLGKDGEPLDPDMIARIQVFATSCGSDENTFEIAFTVD